MTLSGAVLAFECALALLLAATIYFAIRLRGRIDGLRRDRDDMAAALAAFDAASERAERAAAALRAAVADAERDLVPLLARARTARDDLAGLTGRPDRRDLGRRAAGAQP